MKKKKLKTLAQLKKDLWKVFSLYIKERDNWTCFTCGRHCEGSGCHGGHFITKAIGGIWLYFNEDNVHAQCYNCNINLSGNIWEYGQRLGAETVEHLYAIKKEMKNAQWDRAQYEFMIERYKHLNEFAAGKES